MALTTSVVSIFADLVLIILDCNPELEDKLGFIPYVNMQDKEKRISSIL